MIGNRHIDALAICRRSPFHATQRGPWAHLRLPQHSAGIRVESVVNAALLTRANDGLRTRRALVSDFIRCGTKIVVWAGGREWTVGEWRYEAGCVPIITAVCHAWLVPSHQSRGPPDRAGIHVEREDRVRMVMVRVSGRRMAVVVPVPTNTVRRASSTTGLLPQTAAPLYPSGTVNVCHSFTPVAAFTATTLPLAEQQ